jgi:hypothetical protein
LRPKPGNSAVPPSPTSANAAVARTSRRPSRCRRISDMSMSKVTEVELSVSGAIRVSTRLTGPKA